MSPLAAMVSSSKVNNFTLEDMENVYLENVFQSITEKTDFVKRFDEDL
jgi:hypothetical protein